MDVYKHTREAVRVKVKKCEPNVSPEWRKFSIDPSITTMEVLYSLLAKAFDIKADFSIKYKAYDPAGNEIYLCVLSDWDLDAAFLRIHNLSIQTCSEPCLLLQIDVKPFTEVKECDPEIATIRKQLPASAPNTQQQQQQQQQQQNITPLQQSIGASQKYVQHMQTRLPGLIMNQMEKTFSMVQKAFNLTEENIAALPPRPPLSDNEFRMFLDALGQIQRTDELRKVIFFGGIESGLRRVVWKHILNVYPSGMNGHQRMDFMRRKSEQYFKLRDTWQDAVKKGCLVGELGYVTSMVKKDVLRTDRLHPYYAGSDDNQNIASLFNILTTYALNHPSVSYCQGMSDIASPLLVTMNDEAQAYICFCAIMFRVRGNFLLDGIAMTQKFAHLSEALSYYDPEFWDYLKSQQADDLLFCYRWLLLELKREFPFDDALRMLEVQWSSLKYETTTTQNELSLFEKEFVPIMETSAPTTASSISSSLSTGGPTSPSYMLAKPRESAYTKFCALRRQSSTASLSSLSSSLGSNSHALDATKRLNQSLDDNISRHVLTRRQRQVSSEAHQSLDEAKMLMLIENAEKEANNSSTNCINSAPTTAHDEVNHTEAIHFQFHHTNPFKEDAQQLATNAAPASMTERKPIARVFLNSSSSSIAEDETQVAQELPSSITKLQNKNILTNYNTVSNIIAKQLSANATTVSETMKRVSSTGGGHFKDLKEKIAASSKKGLSFEEIANTANVGTGIGLKPSPKLVKNFNEFLNFATTNKSRVADKNLTTNTATTTTILTPQSPTFQHQQQPQPTVQLLKSSRVPSLEDSDSTCSVPDTTWSNSTAATAIQQAQSLNLELNSISSANYSYTPDRTPGGFSPMPVEESNSVADAMLRDLRLDPDNLQRQVVGSHSSDDIEYEKLEKSTGETTLQFKENENVTKSNNKNMLQSNNKYRLAFESDDDSDIQDDVTTTDAATSAAACNENDIDDVFMAPQQQRRATTSFESGTTLNPFIDDATLFCLPNSTSLPEVLVAVSTDDALECDAAIAADPVELATNVIADEEKAQILEKCSLAASVEVNGLPPACTTLPPAPVLPPPHVFGGGNPFLMFLCVTLLLQHRNTIIKNNMDYNEMAMHFDKMVRRHDVTRVLNQARRMYIDYLKVQNAYKQRMQAVAAAAASRRNESSISTAATTAATKAL